MSKKFGMLLMVLVVLLAAAVTYLAFEVTLLKDKHRVTDQMSQGTSSDSDTVLAELREGLKDQQAVIDKILNFVDQLTVQVEKVAGQKFMRAPEYAITETVFDLQEKEGQAQATGNKQRLTQWLDQNEFFLEALLKKTLTLDYDYHRGAVVVADVIPDSVFYQMGFRKGDAILSVNGRAMSKGADLRNSLIELKSKTVTLVRDRKRFTLNIDYTETPTMQEDVANQNEVKSQD